MTGITEEQMELLRKHRDIVEQITSKSEHLEGFEDTNNAAYASHASQYDYLTGTLKGFELAAKILGTDIQALLSELRGLV